MRSTSRGSTAEVSGPNAGVPQDYAPWLWLLAALFLVRVVAQPAALAIDAWFLPPFETWHGGVLPYPVLVASQLVILAWLAVTSWRFTTGDVAPRRRFGLVILVLSSLYFTGMLARLLLGATIMKGQRWLASPLPAFFHMVLAAYLFMYGHFHFRRGAGRDGSRERT